MNLARHHPFYFGFTAGAHPVKYPSMVHTMQFPNPPLHEMCIRDRARQAADAAELAGIQDFPLLGRDKIRILPESGPAVITHQDEHALSLIHIYWI